MAKRRKTPQLKDEVAELAEKGVSKADAATHLGLTVEDLEERFADEWAKGDAKGVVDLTTTLHNAALAMCDAKAAQFELINRRPQVWRTPSQVQAKPDVGKDDEPRPDQPAADGKPPEPPSEDPLRGLKLVS